MQGSAEQIPLTQKSSSLQLGLYSAVQSAPIVLVFLSPFFSVTSFLSSWILAILCSLACLAILWSLLVSFSMPWRRLKWSFKLINLWKMEYKNEKWYNSLYRKILFHQYKHQCIAMWILQRAALYIKTRGKKVFKMGISNSK